MSVTRDAEARVVVGTYEQIETTRRRAWKVVRGSLDLAQQAASEHLHGELLSRRERYLRALLAQLSFRWHVEHAYTPRETATYGGADHVVLDEAVRIGRLLRRPGDTLARPREKFWGLHAVEDGRLPTSLPDIRIAERLVATGRGARRPAP